MIISIDPGVNFCGISVVDASREFTVKEVQLVKNARKFTDEEKNIEAIHGARVVKVLAITSKIESFLEKYPQVNTIVVEAPFYNALTPAAFGSLLEVIFAIRYKIVMARESLRFKMIEPLVVKKLFSNKPMASKEIMKQFLIAKKQDGSIKMENDIELLSEHEIDSIAVGFAYHETCKEQPTT